MVKATLKQLGLNDKEIEVYLTVLQLGSVPASVVGNRLNIPRSTARYICQQLRKKSLLLEIAKGQTMIYSADSPDKLLYLIEQEKKKLQQKEDQTNQIIGELKNMQNPYAVLPKIQFFEGVDGLTAFFNKIADDLKEGDEVLSFVDPLKEDEDKHNIGEIVYAFVKKRIEKNVTTRIIVPECEISRQLKAEDSDNLRETRIVHADNYEWGSGETFVYRDKVCHVTGKDFLFAYMVQNDNIAKMNRTLFEIAWKQAERENAEISPK